MIEAKYTIETARAVPVAANDEAALARSKAGFAATGYTILPLFDPETVRAAKADIKDQIDRVAFALRLPFEQSLPDVPVGERLDRIAARNEAYANLLRLAICTDAHLAPRLSALADDPALIEIASHLTGRRIDERVARVRASIAAFPQHRHGWHSDVALDDGSDCARVRIAAWIPLDDAGPDSGGLEIVSGMRSAPMPHSLNQGFEIEDEALNGLPRVAPFCPAGSILFLDCFTPHRTLKVTGPARFALLVWMKGD